MVREDKVEGYRAYLALHPSQPTAPAVRIILVRRQLMIAWHTAVTINTAASYQAFLAAGAAATTPPPPIVCWKGRGPIRLHRGFRLPTAPACPCSQPVNRCRASAAACRGRRTPSQSERPVGAQRGGRTIRHRWW